MNVSKINGSSANNYRRILFGNSDKQNSKVEKTNWFSENNLLIVGSILAATAIAGIVCYRNRRANAISATTNSTPPQRPLWEEIIITGKERVKKIVSRFNHSDYDASQSGFKVNMHIHSKYSDGNLTPSEILLQAKSLADKLPNGEKFTFSLTDHDTVEGVKEIVKLIKADPNKYKNVRFIPGIELSTSYKNPSIMETGADLDYLIYGFNPENPRLQQEISRRKNILISSTQALINELNAIAGKNFLVQDILSRQDNQLRNVCSNGYLNSLRKSLVGLAEDNNISQETLYKILEKHFGHTHLLLKTNIPTTDAAKLASEINAFSSIAHPGKTNFEHSKLFVNGTIATNDIIETILNTGGDAIECHYMSYSANKGQQHWWEEIREALKPLKLLYCRTGGYDTHGKSICKK